MKTQELFGSAVSLAPRAQVALLGQSAHRCRCYVITHERSGTHLTIDNVLRNTYMARFEVVEEWFGPYSRPETRFDHVDEYASIWARSLRGGTLIKSHCDRELFEARYPKAPVIYVLRDPRDTLTSFFHFLNHEAFYNHSPRVADHRCQSFSEFLRRPVSEFLRYGFSLKGEFENVVERWAQHVRGWVKRSDPGVLVVRYERWLENFRGTLSHICDFLGIRPKFKLRPVGLKEGKSVLPRKGIVGDWRTCFNADDEEFVRRTLEKYGLDGLYQA